jgi:beta-glucosidase
VPSWGTKSALFDCPAPPTDKIRRVRTARRILLALATVAVGAMGAATSADAAGRCGTHPWCDTSLPPDQRAALLVEALTPQERIALLAGDHP